MSRPPLQQSFLYGSMDNEEVLRGLGGIDGRLLDVGSGVGSWAPRLRAAGARELVALDPSAQAIAAASDRYDVAVVGTIEDATLAQLGGRPFDVIVAADVLEHLVDPWRALRTLRSWAAPDALLAVSVPNLRFYRLVGNLVLRGQFEYEPWGVRDWTHLRWFTRASLAHALAASGWAPQRWVTSTTLKGRLLARVSEQLANDFLRQQLTVVARASAPRQPRAPESTWQARSRERASAPAAR
ncbi:MAG TPA: class I SAM-dependent methyltransferase [Solirubrobacteraceae bacterium]|nr:class I SAM-dependent methyltransferase [Solirubrobacteraceae bacterium]